MSDDGLQITNAEQRTTLLIVLVLNLFLFVALGISGILADSSALIANAVDNLGDTAMYALSWFAVGKSDVLKTRAARLSGVMLLLFAALVIVDAVRRPFAEAEPLGLTMIVMAAIAAAVNLLCLRLLKPMRQTDVNLRAAQTFSANDFLANGGIVVAGLLVAWTGSFWPDILVGGAVGLLAFKGGLEILADTAKSPEQTNG
jgi:cobalt-zinc-cadmium efflux system protein